MIAIGCPKSSTMPWALRLALTRAQLLAIYAAKMALMTGASSGDGGGDPLLASAAMADWRSMSSAIMEL